MEKYINILPFVLGIGLIAVGLGIIIYRTKAALRVQGTITGIAKSTRKYSRVKITLEAPAVKYTVKGVEYSVISRKFFTEGVMEFKKGKNISIRVNRRNYKHFVPDESGKTAEKLLIACGIFMIIANAVILWRYGI